MPTRTEVAIVGGGLAGLALAVRLHQAGVDFQLFEARTRFGGRIAALETPAGAVDLGPSWFWPGQPRITGLVAALGIAPFPQYARGTLSYEDETGQVHRGMGFASMEGSIRVAGGVARIIDGLVARLPQDRLHRGAAVTAIARDGGVTLAGGQTCQATHHVLALPPRVAARLAFSPALDAVQTRSLEDIPTWMAGHAKFVALYDAPFWRADGLSGDAMSRRGPLMEVHDASGPAGDPAALFGFVGVPAVQRKDQAEAVKAAALAQLVRLFGDKAGAPIAMALQDWAAEPETATARDMLPPAGHPHYGLAPALVGLWDGRLHFASTEAAPEAGGFMEGALAAAEAVALDLGLPGDWRP